MADTSLELLTKPSPYGGGKKEWDICSFVFLAYFGTADVNLGTGCRNVIDKKGPANRRITM